jgi:hypothetical protein
MSSGSEDEDSKLDAMKEAMTNTRIHCSDFTKTMELKAVRYAIESIVKGKMDKDCATAIKTKVDEDKDFDDNTIGSWQVIVGKSFAASLTYHTSFMMFFDLIKQRRTILIFKTQ